MKFKSNKYINQLIEAKENGFPKVIIGIKSVVHLIKKIKL